MATFTIEVNGYGGEFVMAKITEEQFEFWVNNQDNLPAHIFWDPYEIDPAEEYPNLVDDDEDPRFLGQWWDLEGELSHIYGASLENCRIYVSNSDGDTVWESSNIENYTQSLELEDETESFYLHAFSMEKGNFWTFEIEDDKFDPTQLHFYVSELYEDKIITGVSYRGKELEGDGGDTTGKGYDFQLIEDL